MIVCRLLSKMPHSCHIQIYQGADLSGLCVDKQCVRGGKAAKGHKVYPTCCVSIDLISFGALTLPICPSSEAFCIWLQLWLVKWSCFSVQVCGSAKM